MVNRLHWAREQESRLGQTVECLSSNLQSFYSALGCTSARVYPLWVMFVASVAGSLGQLATSI